MTAPIQLLLIGAAGRMGLAITRLAGSGVVPGFRITAAVDSPSSPLMGKDVGVAAGLPPLGIAIGSDLAAAIAAGPDVAIDFSAPSAAPATAEALANAGIPWVIGTTGLNDAEKAALQAAADRIPVMFAANTSLGINLLYVLVEQAARALRGRGYDCEITERHHRHKKDAPSGTALYLGRAAADGYQWDLAQTAVHGRSGITGERPEQQIGFHALRGGDIPGDHAVLFATDGETIELSHRATSRDTFAIGALRAAAWLPGRPPALYSMRDVLNLNPGGTS